MVGRMARGAEPKERFAARERIAIKEELFSPAVARFPAKQRMLPVLAIAHIIGKRPIGVGHGGIVFLDPALHFGKQRFLQGGIVGEGVLAIIVFCLQVSADRRIELLRIAHHLPPIRVFEPSELIGEPRAVQIADKRPLLRPRLAWRANVSLGSKLRVNPIMGAHRRGSLKLIFPRGTVERRKT